MPQNPWSFMPPAARLMPFQQGFGVPPGGSPGVPGAPGMMMPGMTGPQPLPARPPAPMGQAPQMFNAPRAPQAPRLGGAPPPQMMGSAGHNPFQMGSMFGGAGSGGSNDLFNAMRELFASSTGNSMSAPQIMRFFSPEETSIKSFKPPPPPEEPPPAPRPAPSAEEFHLRLQNTGDGGGPGGGGPGGGGPGGGGPGGGGGGGAGGGGGGCFGVGSPVLMADRSTKPIEDIEIGDITAGGRVTGVMVFEGDHHAYDYLGVVVSGSHGVLENGEWMRVRDSFHGRKLPAPVDRWYLHDTTSHQIVANGIRFTDFHETEMDNPLQAARAEASLAYLNGMERKAVA